MNFARPLTKERLFELSGLMGNRLLINIYEADIPLLAEALSDQARFDRAQFYSSKNRLCGEAVRTALEQHIFSWIEERQHDADETPAYTMEYCVRRAAQSSMALAQVIESALDRRRMGQFLAIQLCGPLRSKELAIDRLTVVDWTGKWTGWTADASQVARHTRQALSAFAVACGLLDQPHAYWQFYLGSYIAVANFLYRTVRDPLRFFEAVGAIVFDRSRAAAVAERWCEVAECNLGASAASALAEVQRAAQAEDVTSSALQILEGMGATAHDEVAAFKRGVEGMCRVSMAADEDLQQQIDWADRAKDHQIVANRYMQLIHEYTFPVDLETYIESSSERSTTHVHDTDRLLVIESGEMDFWHSLGEPLRFRAGDMIYVPRYRLHGSVVASPKCVYHQPIVDTKLHSLL